MIYYIFSNIFYPFLGLQIYLWKLKTDSRIPASDFLILKISRVYEIFNKKLLLNKQLSSLSLYSYIVYSPPSLPATPLRGANYGIPSFPEVDQSEAN